MPALDDRISRFLSANRGNGFCATCLATNFDAPFRDTQEAITRLADHYSFSLGRDKCTLCTRPVLVIRALTALRGSAV